MNSHGEHVWRHAETRLGKAWVKSGSRLRPGVVVEVTELYADRLAAWVETAWGVSMRVFCHHLDFGYEFRTRRGEWLAEGEPRARRWLLRVRGELLGGAAPRHEGDGGRMLELEEVERILGRNGWRERPRGARRGRS